MTQLKLEMGRVDGVDLLKNFLVFAGRSLHNGADGVSFLPKFIFQQCLILNSEYRARLV